MSSSTTPTTSVGQGGRNEAGSRNTRPNTAYGRRASPWWNSWWMTPMTASATRRLASTLRGESVFFAADSRKMAKPGPKSRVKIGKKRS